MKIKTKLVVQYTVGVPDYSSRCTGTWIVIHDGSCKEFQEALRDVMKKAEDLWYDEMLVSHTDYVVKNLYYCKESKSYKTKKGLEAVVSDVTIFHREDLDLNCN